MTLVDIVALILVAASFIVLGVIPMFAIMMRDDGFMDESDAQSNEC